MIVRWHLQRVLTTTTRQLSIQCHLNINTSNLYSIRLLFIRLRIYQNTDNQSNNVGKKYRIQNLINRWPTVITGNGCSSVGKFNLIICQKHRNSNGAIILTALREVRYTWRRYSRPSLHTANSTNYRYFGCPYTTSATKTEIKKR